MDVLGAAVCGVLLVSGLLAVLHGCRPVGHPAPPRPPKSMQERWALLTRRPQGPAGRRRDQLLVGGLVVGLVTYLLTGWVLLLIAVPFAVLAAPWLLGNPPNAEIELLGALDRWIRGLSATLPTGQSIADAIRSSIRHAPPLLRPEIALVVARLDQRWSVRDALLAMADRLDSPDADAVLAALALSGQRGGTGATATLTALSESIGERLRALRDIEAERTKPRVVVRQVTLISFVVLAISLAVGGEFFAPYRTPVGQLILGLLVACYVASLVFLRRMTAPPKRERILQNRSQEMIGRTR